MKGVLGVLGAVVGVWLILNLIGALIVGAIARAVLPGKDKVGWPMTILIGFLGGMLGKVVAFIAGWRHLGWFRGLLVSIIGALALLIAHRVWTISKAKAPSAAKTSP